MLLLPFLSILFFQHHHCELYCFTLKLLNLAVVALSSDPRWLHCGKLVGHAWMDGWMDRWYSAASGSMLSLLGWYKMCLCNLLSEEPREQWVDHDPASSLFHFAGQPKPFYLYLACPRHSGISFLIGCRGDAAEASLGRFAALPGVEGRT